MAKPTPRCEGTVSKYPFTDTLVFEVAALDLNVEQFHVYGRLKYENGRWYLAVSSLYDIQEVLDYAVEVGFTEVPWRV